MTLEEMQHNFNKAAEEEKLVLANKIFTEKMTEALPLLIPYLGEENNALQKTVQAGFKTYEDKKAILSLYLTSLNFKDPLVVQNLLRKIEKQGKGMEGIGRWLVNLLHHPDYMVRSRAFITMRRIEDSSVASLLVRYLYQVQEEEWRLRALEVLSLIGSESDIPHLAVLLDDYSMPIFVRGLIWTIGSIGGSQALTTVVKYMKKDQSRLVKDQVLFEALARAINSYEQGAADYEKILATDEIFAKMMAHITLPAEEEYKFDVYPYPDYLFKKVTEGQGIDGRAYKKLFYWEQD